MTGLPPPSRRRRPNKTPKKKPKDPTADEVMAELPKADAVQDEVITVEEALVDRVNGPEVIRDTKTNNVFSFLWRGEGLPKFSNDVYNTLYVENLYYGIKRHVPRGQLTLLVDDYYELLLKDEKRFKDIRIEKFDNYGVGGWSNVLEVCRNNLRPKLGKRHVCMGLDTILMGDCQWLFDWKESIVGLPMDPIYRDKACNAVMTMNFEGAAFVWDAFEVAMKDQMKDYLLFGHPSEMVLLRYLFDDQKWKPLEEGRPRKLLSYKCDIPRGANPRHSGASIVYFHGNPKPADLRKSDKVWQEWMRR